MSDHGAIDFREIHWLIDMLQSIDVGLIVLDHDYQVQTWNNFMENHSGMVADQVLGRSLFGLFPELPRDWFLHKAESVRLLKNRSFTIWEQRPYLFRFRNYRPITGSAEFMYQNTTLIPLTSAAGEVTHIGIIVYDVTDIAVSTRELESANAQLGVLSRTDQLTRLNNRGYWEECLEGELQRVRRTGQPASLVMFDIDHFKRVNDTWGHQAGDEVLRAVSGALRECMRATDVAGRYGGEEFGVVLVDTTEEGARTFAERLRSGIEKLVIEHQGQRIRCTISLGIAQATEDLEDRRQWIRHADEALYQAKESGRNRVIVFKTGEKVPAAGYATGL